MNIGKANYIRQDAIADGEMLTLTMAFERAMQMINCFSFGLKFDWSFGSTSRTSKLVMRKSDDSSSIGQVLWW